ncbi:MAG: hypothetical protein ABL889_19995 [Terricaulis sp.]
MTNTTRRGVILGAVGSLAVSGCATGGLVSGQIKSGSITTQLQREWSDITFMLPPPRPRNVKMFSIDGPLLNRLYVATLAEGGSLLRPRDRDTPRPVYRSDMSDNEIVEFIVDCVAQEYIQPEATALRPQSLGSAPGIRFDISTRTDEGLGISGTALAASISGRLGLLLFLAPTEHYYGALASDVDAICASARPA